MALPPSPPPGKPPAPMRPSLLAGPADDRDGAGASDFAASILSAAHAGPRGARPGSTPRGVERRSAWRWWLGIALAAAALLALAQWQRSSAKPMAVPAPVLLARAASAPVAPSPVAVQASAPAELPHVAASAAAPASSPLDLLAAAPEPVPTAKPAARAAPRKPAASDARLVQALAAAPKASAARDADAELFAALMAHSDGSKAREAEPLPPSDRNRLAVKLRACRAQGNAAAQDSCRVDACSKAKAWGRTKSCMSRGGSASKAVAAAAPPAQP